VALPALTVGMGAVSLPGLAASAASVASSPPVAVPHVAGPSRSRITNPLAAQQFFDAQRAAPYGHIPAGAYARALQQRDEINARARALGLQPNAPGASWSLIGPAPLHGATTTCPTSACPLGPYGDNGGRVTTLAYDGPANNVLYAGTENGGVWKTADGGVTWTPLSDNLQSLAVNAVAVVPGKTAAQDTIYIGTGEQNFNEDGYYGVGLYKSTDGGATWQGPYGQNQFGFGYRNPLDSQVARGNYVGKIVVDPNDATHVLVASSQGVFLSTDGGLTFPTQNLVDNTLPHSYITDLIVDPSTTPSTVYAAWGYPFGGFGGPFAAEAAHNGVYKSTDGGVTFSAAPIGTGYPTGAGIGRISLAESAPNGTVYLTAADPLDTSSMGVWTSTDQGATWTQVTAAYNSGGPDLYGDDLPANVDFQQGSYDIWIAVDPNDATKVYVGGINVWASTAGGCATANCLTFTDTTNVYTTLTFTPHPDEHAFAFTGNPTVLWVGNDGGVYNTADGGTTWADKVGNLETLEFYAGSAGQNVLTNPVAFGGAQDNGTSKYTGSPVWNAIFGGDGGFTTNENTLNPQTVYEEYVFLNIFKSTDGGTTWTSAPVTNGIDPSDSVGFIAPYIMDQSNSNHLLAGTNRVYETTNGAALWNPISPVLSPTGFISALAFARSAPNTTFYAGTSDGQIWRTTNDGGSWTNITAGTVGVTGRYVTSLGVDSANPQDVVVTFSGFANSTGTGIGTHVYRSPNGGATWSDISIGLPDSPVNSVLRNPLVSNAFYIGADDGFWYTTNGGITWLNYQNGLPNSPINQLFADGNFTTIFAATAGRGMATLPSTAINAINGCTLTAAINTQTKHLGAAGSTTSFPIHYITYQDGGSTFVVRSTAMTCPSFSLASSTVSVSGLISTMRGTLFSGATMATVKFTYLPWNLFYGNRQPTSVEVIVNSTTPYDVTINPPYRMGSNLRLLFP
jgi:photosystem II stability/assembly factor-like uncharacterized protein